MKTPHALTRRLVTLGLLACLGLPQAQAQLAADRPVKARRERRSGGAGPTSFPRAASRGQARRDSSGFSEIPLGGVDFSDGECC